MRTLPSISARLDRIPFGRFHVRLLAIGGLGYMFDAMDVAIIAFVLPVLKLQWHLSSARVGLLAAAAAGGGFFGALLAGWLGDVIGRRAVMMWALALYCVATLAASFVHSWRPFLTWRVIAGIGTYGESAIVAPFLAEFAGPTFRGRYLGTLVSFFSCGFLLAAVVGIFVVPWGAEAWRYALVVTALPVIMLLWWRRSLPESPRWLVCRGRFIEADEVVARLEREFEAYHGTWLPGVPAVTDGKEQRQMSGRTGIRTLLSRPFICVMCMALVVWFTIGFAYYAFVTWIPSLLVERGMSITGSYTYSFAIYGAQIPGYLTAAALNDFVGRRAVITLYTLLSALAALVLAATTSNVSALIAGIGVSFFLNGSYAGIYAYTPELFPTEVRATAQGLASSLSRIGAFVSPIAVGYIFPVSGFLGVFSLCAGILFAGSLAVLVLGIPTDKRSLEQITG